jgi:hypothetical protein
VRACLAEGPASQITVCRLWWASSLRESNAWSSTNEPDYSVSKHSGTFVLRGKHRPDAEFESHGNKQSGDWPLRGPRRAHAPKLGTRESNRSSLTMTPLIIRGRSMQPSPREIASPRVFGRLVERQRLAAQPEDDFLALGEIDHQVVTLAARRGTGDRAGGLAKRVA